MPFPPAEYMGHNPNNFDYMLSNYMNTYYDSLPRYTRSRFNSFRQPGFNFNATKFETYGPPFYQPRFERQRVKMAWGLSEIFLSAVSTDEKVRTEAEGRLMQFEKESLPGLILSLSHELSNDVKPLDSRKLAGIMLKNYLDSKDPHLKKHCLLEWTSNDLSFKSQIKGLLLNTLGSSFSEAGRTAAQVIAKIASIEIPRKEWPELIGTLYGNVTQQDRPASLKRASLEALGYVCEEISSSDLVQDEVNSVLTAVVLGMNVTQQTDVRLAATIALSNALDFAKTNFENEMERLHYESCL